MNILKNKVIKTAKAARAALLALAMLAVPSSCDSDDGNRENLIAYGKKLVTIGDSLTECCEWQPWLVEWLGFEWSSSETVYGTGGHAAMAVGGTWVKPNYDNSIYIRSLDAKYYSPDVIFIYVASNDPISYWSSSIGDGRSYDEIVADEEVYRGTEVDRSVSTLSAYMGMVENLMDDCPEARIYLIGIMPLRCEIGMNPTDEYASMYPSPRFADMDAVIEFEMSERYPKHELVRAVAKKYSLPFISLWEMSGITDENAYLYYGDVAGDCTQVHPNSEGNKRIAECIRDYILAESI